MLDKRYVIAYNANLMDTEQLREHYRGVSKFCRAAGIGRQTYYDWEKAGQVPENWQLHLMNETRGALKADPPIIKKYRELLKYA